MDPHPRRHPPPLLLALLPGWIYSLVTLGFFVLACWVAGEAEKILGEKDSHKIVIDEIVGFLVTFIAIKLTFFHFLLGFLLVRFFDVIKLYPARMVEKKLPGGFGVVGDDVIAGIYANLVLQCIIFIGS